MTEVVWDFTGDRFLSVVHREASLTDDGGYFVRVWDAKTGKAVGEAFLVGQENPNVSFSPDGKHVLVRRGKTAGVYDAATGKEVREVKFSAE